MQQKVFLLQGTIQTARGPVSIKFHRLGVMPPKPGAFVSPVRVPSLMSLCLGKMADNLEGVTSLDALPEELVVELLNTVISKGNLNLSNVNLFLDAGHTSIENFFRTYADFFRAMPPPGAEAKGCRPVP